MSDNYDSVKSVLKEIQEDPDNAFPEDDQYQLLTNVVSLVRRKVLGQKAPVRDRRSAVESLIDEAIKNRK